VFYLLLHTTVRPKKLVEQN